MPGILELIALLLIGAFGGFFAGLLGIGGGIIFIPFLDYMLQKYGLGGEELVRFILANSLFAIIFSGIISSYKQYRNNNFFLKPVLFTAIPGIITSLLISWLIAKANWYTNKEFTWFFLLLLIYVFIKTLVKKTDRLTEHDTDLDSVAFKFILTGCVTGVVSSLSGLGGGIIMIPIFTNFIKIDIKKATSLSIGVIPFFALPMALFYLFSTPQFVISNHFQSGYIYFPFVIPMALGVLFFAPWGVKIGQKISSNSIRIIFVLFIFVTIVKMVLNIFK